MAFKNTQQLIDACKEKELSATLQRITILRVLQQMEGHPTVEEIFRQVQLEIPTISLATVYKNLETLTQNKLVTQVTRLHDVTRYDVNNEPHHHLVCVQCRKIVDVDGQAVPQLSLPAAASHGFEIFGFQIQFDGLCAECRAESLKRQP